MAVVIGMFPNGRNISKSFIMQQNYTIYFISVNKLTKIRTDNLFFLHFLYLI